MTLYDPYDFFKGGPFAETQKIIDDFANSITLSFYFEECARQQILIEKEYLEAILNGDEELAEEKRQELNMCEGAFRITATLFDTEANIS